MRAWRLIVLFGLWTALALIVQMPLLILALPLARRFQRVYFAGVKHILGLRIVTSGHAPAPGPAIWLINHISWLDIFVLAAAGPVTFIAKREVRGWPVFGWFARAVRTVFIDRTRRSAAARDMQALKARLRDGETLVLFAEGTSSDGNRVLPFKSALLSAAENNPAVAVQPVTLVYTSASGLPLTRRQRASLGWYGGMALLPHIKATLMAGPISATLYFHEALDPVHDGGRKQMAAKAETAIRNTRARLAAGLPLGE